MTYLTNSSCDLNLSMRNHGPCTFNVFFHNKLNIYLFTSYHFWLIYAMLSPKHKSICFYMKHHTHDRGVPVGYIFF